MQKGDMSAQWGLFASGLALGGIIGAGVALLLAPHSGEETRSLIGEKSSGLKDQISGKVNEVRGAALQESNDLKDQIAGKVNEIRSAAQQQMGSVKEHLESRSNQPSSDQPF